MRRFSGNRLGDEIGICQHGPCHRHHVGASCGKNLLGDLWRVDAVRGDDGNRDLAHQFFRHPGKGCARHGRGNGRNARFMPADAGIDDRRTGFLDLLRQFDHLFVR